MSAKAWFRFFPSDWLSGAASLSAAEKGVYITITALIYDHEAPVKRDDARLARLCGLPVAPFRRILGTLIELGKIIEEDDHLTNARAESELTERQIRMSHGAQGANARWKNNETKSMGERCPSNARASAEQCPNDATRARVPQPQPKEEKKEPRARRAFADEGFNRFWEAWPHKVGKLPAQKAFAKVAVEIEAIVAGIASYIRDKPPDRPWLNPSTFLNQRRWEDAPAPSNVVRLTPTGPQIADPEKTINMGFNGRIVTRRVVADHVRLFLESGKWYFESPKPGEPDCRVPSDLLPPELRARRQLAL